MDEAGWRNGFNVLPGYPFSDRFEECPSRLRRVIPQDPCGSEVTVELLHVGHRGILIGLGILVIQQPVKEDDKWLIQDNHKYAS